MYPFAQCTRWEKCILQKTGTFVPAMKQWFVDVAPPPPPSPARPTPPSTCPPPTPVIGFSGAIVTSPHPLAAPLPASRLENTTLLGSAC